ncbi:MAG: tetratricopeptide repeat protein [Limisphaerales bacterium]
MKIWPWLEANIKRIVIATGILAVLIFIFSYFSYQRQQKEILAGQAFTALVVSSTANARSNPGADDYLKLAAEYPGTQAGKRAVLQGAAALFTTGKYAEAQAQFQNILMLIPMIRRRHRRRWVWLQAWKPKAIRRRRKRISKSHHSISR